MIRKLAVVLLSGAIFSLATAPLLAETKNWGWPTLQEYEEATGNKIEKFNEAPILRTKVAAGELPPIEERLPEEPLVDEPFEEVGRYGGVLRTPIMNLAVQRPTVRYMTEYMLNLDRDGRKVVPNIAKGWEYSEDGKTFTLFLRKGMKWSDGAPFTADDILFYWEDVILNDEITPVKPQVWMPGGELMTVEKVNDYTVSFRFSQPYFTMHMSLSGVGFRGAQNYIFLPKHALKKYHIDHNPKADELAKEEDYAHWWELFNDKRGFLLFDRKTNLDIPIVGPWAATQLLPEGVVYERNPYYFKIDTAGNQLPYIDTVKGTPFNDPKTLVLNMVSGKYDQADAPKTNPLDYSVLMEGAEKGGYKVWLAYSVRGDEGGYFINQNYNEDPVVGDILRDIRFRRALSVAVNREEINDMYHLGNATPGQATVHPSSSFYKEEWTEAYAKYNPEEANRLLDEMGMDKRDKEEYRLSPDGTPFHLIMNALSYHMGIGAELIREYWEEVGIRTSIKEVLPQYLYTLRDSSAYMVCGWVFPMSAEAAVMAGMTYGLTGNWWAVQWRTWWNTNGESGEEPPDNVKRMWLLYDQVPNLPEEEAIKALTEVFDIWSENVWYVGTVAMTVFPSITNINLGNVNTNTSIGGSVGVTTFNRLYQAFWKN